MLAAPEGIGRQRHQAAQAAEEVVGAARAEERAVPAIMLDDEDADEKAGGEQRQRQGDPDGKPQTQIHCGAGRQKPAERGCDLHTAAGEARSLERGQCGENLGHSCPPRTRRRRNLGSACSDQLARINVWRTPAWPAEFPGARFYPMAMAMARAAGTPAATTARSLRYGDPGFPTAAWDAVSDAWQDLRRAPLAGWLRRCDGGCEGRCVAAGWRCAGRSRHRAPAPRPETSPAARPQASGSPGPPPASAFRCRAEKAAPR